MLTFLWRVLYNSPVSDEIAVLMPNDNMSNRDVVLHYRDGGLRHISELHRSYDPLQYPLLFPHGTNGWYVNLKLQNDILYYCYVRIILWLNKMCLSCLELRKRLFQQFLVDAYFNIKTERLQFLRCEQTALRADCYQDLVM